jgi:DNA-binding response OmpR family regulator
MPTKILIVEDERDFREGLVELLKIEGFDAHGVESIASYDRWSSCNDYDILILDRNLPDGDGLEILKKRSSTCGSIILSCEGQTHDRIQGLNADADYYLVKPFPMDELVAILSRLERKMLIKDDANVWKLNQIRWEIESPNHLEIELTKSEFSLLNNFIDKPGLVISREDIIRGLGFNPIDYDNRRLEVMLRRLRKKIEDAGVVKFPLQTVYGVGLAFTEKLKSSQN